MIKSTLKKILAIGLMLISLSAFAEQKTIKLDSNYSISYNTDFSGMEASEKDVLDVRMFYNDHFLGEEIHYLTDEEVELNLYLNTAKIYCFAVRLGKKETWTYIYMGQDFSSYPVKNKFKILKFEGI